MTPTTYLTHADLADEIIDRRAEEPVSPGFAQHASDTAGDICRPDMGGAYLGNVQNRADARGLRAELDAVVARTPDRHGSRVDLWETNSGGLCIVDRARGIGFFGFERGQNEKRLRVVGRDEFTFVSDAGSEDFDSLDEGSAYTRMDAADIEALYEREGETNQAVLVASCADGEVTIYTDRSIGLAARWYLDTEVVS